MMLAYVCLILTAICVLPHISAFCLSVNETMIFFNQEVAAFSTVAFSCLGYVLNLMAVSS